MLALGIFAFVPGMMEPRAPSLMIAGTLAMIVGLLELCLVRTPRIPASCRKEAKELLARRRAIDWSKTAMKVHFDESGMTASHGEEREFTPYEKLTGVFETENLWLLVYGGEKGLLLKKEDLISGDGREFSAYLHHRMITENP